MSTSGCENRPSLVTAPFNVIPSFSDTAFFELTKKFFSCNFRFRQELTSTTKSIVRKSEFSGISVVQEQVRGEPGEEEQRQRVGSEDPR